MNKSPLFILLLLAVSVCAFAAKPRVIVNPSYEAKSSGIFNVSKIELLDHETRVHVHNTFLPNYWVNFTKEVAIKDSETGKLYPATRIEGGEFNKKIFLPASGDSTIVIVFPALDKGTKKIDYDDCIFGISLAKNKQKKTAALPASVTAWLDNELAKAPKKGPIDLNSPLFFNADTARIVGYLNGYDTRLGFSTGIIYTKNEITRTDFPTVMQIFPDGRFEVNLPMTHPVYSKVVISKQWIPFYLEPGQTLAMILNWDDFLTADRMPNIRYHFKDTVFKGPLAKMNKDLASFPLEQFDYQAYQKKVETLSPDEFKKEQLASQTESIKKVENYSKSNALTAQTASILINEIRLSTATKLFDYLRNREYASQQNPSNEILKQPTPKGYYDFLKDIPLSETSLLVLDEYSTFINRLEFSPPMRVQARNNMVAIKPEKGFLDYLEEEKIEIPTEDKELYLLIENPEKLKELGADIHSKLNGLEAKYSEHRQSYYQKYVKSAFAARLGEIALEQWRLKDSVLTNVLGLVPNLTYDITKLRNLAYVLSEVSVSVAPGYWSSLKAGIQHPYLVATGDKMVNKVLRDKENIAFELPKGFATEVFKKIIDPFKGKVLFVDFWATSCGPCVGNIKDMKLVREEYKDNKDFDFIFITDDRSSPDEHYSKFVEEQALKNTFRLSTDDYNYLRQLFKFNGIPRYVVIDKRGNVLNEDFQMHNFKYELDKILSSAK